MSSRNRPFLTVVVLLLAASGYANATTTQTKPVSNSYNVEALYNEKHAYIGNRNLELKITVQPIPGVAIREQDRLTLVSVQSPDNPEIKIRQASGGGGSYVYLYKVELDEGLEPRTYRLTLEFQEQGGATLPPVYIDLDVGVRSHGKLKLIGVESGTLVLSAERTIRVRFENGYVDYPVNINRIKIYLTPATIERVEVKDGVENPPVVRNNVIIFDPALTIEPAQHHSLDIALKLGRMPSLQNYVTGLGDDSKLTFEVYYDDGRGRSISDLREEIKIKVRPNDRFLAVALIIGLLAGTGIKFYLEYLHKKGKITKKGVAGFVITTMVVGLVIFVFALVGEIQIIAFNRADLSYDKPGVLFLLSCTAALTGVHYLNKWLNPKSSEGN